MRKEIEALIRITQKEKPKTWGFTTEFC
jgi:hypothetical protein